MRVGFIGLGTMGSGISANMRKAGHHLVVHDLGAVGCVRECVDSCGPRTSMRHIVQHGIERVDGPVVQERLWKRE